MKHLRILLLLVLDKKCDGHSLTDIKHIFILASFRGCFFFQTVAVKVQNIHLIKRFHQTLAHSPKSGIIQITVIGDHAHNPVSGLLDLPLSKAQELYIIVLEPFGVSLAQRFAVHYVITLGSVNVLL